jgi:hypothetical protein
MKGSVYQRGSKWYYKFRVRQIDPPTGRAPWISKRDFPTVKEAWRAWREVMGADNVRVVKPSTRTVGKFLTESLAAVEPALDATTWRNRSDYADHYLSVAEAEQQELPPGWDTARTQQESR